MIILIKIELKRVVINFTLNFNLFDDSLGIKYFYMSCLLTLTFICLEFPSNAVEFPDLCRHLLGPWAEWIAAFFSLIPLLGGAVVYWVLMSNFLYFIGVYAFGMIFLSLMYE